jgi:hypothetical protein
MHGDRHVGKPPVERSTPAEQLNTATFVEGISTDPAVGPGQRTEQKIELQPVDVVIPG